MPHQNNYDGFSFQLTMDIIATSTAYDPERVMQMSQAVTESDQMHHETHANDAEGNSSTTYSTLEYGKDLHVHLLFLGQGIETEEEEEEK